MSLRYGMRVAGGVVAAPLRKDGTPLDLSSARVPGGLGHEVIGIQVSNMSRTARVRVESIAATVESGPSFDPQGTAIGDPLPRWLEPGETNSWYMDAATAKQLVQIMRGAGKNVDRVRMVASISPGIAAKTPEQLVVPES